MDTYIASAFKELFNQDGMTVMGRGLGINRLLLKFIQYYTNPPIEKDKKKKLVFVMNTSSDLIDIITNGLLAEGLLPYQLPRVVTSEYSSEVRNEMFSEGGCFIITSKILIVDLLDKKIDPINICGFLIPNAHR